MYWTTYSEAILLNTFRGQQATAPAALYAAGFLSNPGNAGGGTEIIYEGYNRMPIEFSPPAPGGGGEVSMSNVADVPFATSPTNAGTITHFALMDAVSGGNVLAYIALDQPIAVNAGVAPLLLAGEWTYASSGNFSNHFKTACLNWLRGVNIAGFMPYAALYNGNPDSGGQELSGPGYARFAIPFGAPQIQAAGQTSIVNSADAAGPRSLGAWGNWNWTALHDAASLGNPVVFSQEASSTIMGAGMAVIFDAGNYTVSVN